MDIEKVRGKIASMDTEEFRKLRASLSRDEMQALRPEFEARRGIERDPQGRIIRSKEWKRNRISFLNDRIADYETRIKNAKAEIKTLEKELNSK
jgi:predicted RNase H-like nuclease (RuvC/YqgF family)